MSTTNASQFFDDLEAIIAQHSYGIYGYLKSFRSQIHQFAEQQHPVLERILIRGLSHPDSDWRYESLNLLGFHYPLSGRPQILNMIRALLRDESEDQMIRRLAASILGLHSQWNDSALVDTFNREVDQSIRQAIFVSLLKLAGVPRKRTFAIEREILFKRAWTTVSWDTLFQVLDEEGITPLPIQGTASC